jgi:hypothetical protein
MQTILGEGAPRVTLSQMTQKHMRSARIDLLFTMSDNTRASGRSRLTCELVSHERVALRRAVLAAPIEKRCRTIEDVWWSQTGSNRRPPACKAGALPTELWPRTSQHSLACRAEARAPRSPALVLRTSARQPALRGASEGWWAWEDLNFRPHAYQARALTN